ncbi:MAG: hypothetical protein H3C33_10445 [Rhodocyclaceae bacterium]|nr:hypothetical protein [Rhodocyclaceae bacterium]
MSSTTVIDTAPFGALIRYTDGNPKPPAHFTNKLTVKEPSSGVKDGGGAGGADPAA